MISREEYNKALDIVEEYHKQLFMGGSTDRKTVDDWINENYAKISGRLIQCLESKDFDTNSRYFTYIDEVTRRKFFENKKQRRKVLE